MTSLPVFSSLPPTLNSLTVPELKSRAAPELNSLAVELSFAGVNFLTSKVYFYYIILYCQLGMMAFRVTMATSFYFYSVMEGSRAWLAW